MFRQPGECRHRGNARQGDGLEAPGGLLSRAARAIVKAPILLYRWTVRPWLGWPCRHLPTCSDYALEAIDRNGAWRGFWLMISRLLRCQPFGTAGFDPVPDIRDERHFWQPWRYGRWTGAHMRAEDKWDVGAAGTRGEDHDERARTPAKSGPQQDQSADPAASAVTTSRSGRTP